MHDHLRHEASGAERSYQSIFSKQHMKEETFASDLALFPVRTLRQQYGENGLSQEELANIAGIAVRTLRDIEEGRTNPSLESTIRLSIALDIPIDDLLDQDWITHLRGEIESRRADALDPEVHRYLPERS
ncbi:MAG: helix-turn-helix transcriptional regulator [Deltaproteobacteria bacterium]|nr:helix-turn-helix transcriptional regulator [Deltaproteobacteria bacterium]